MELTFHNWKIDTGKWDARQYDNGVWELLLTGDLPDGWAWQALISQNDKLDIIDLTVSEKGVSATLTAENLALTGYYTIQIRGTKGDKVRHTNLVQVYIPRSLSGDATWPEIPTEFSQMEDRIRALAEHPPIPGDGYWMIWDMNAGMYQKSNFRLTVDPVEKDAGMTEPVGVDEDGKLWTAPGGATSVTADAIEKALGYTPADKKTIPTTLPSPHALTFTGAVTGNYDGSQDVSVEIPRGGGMTTEQKNALDGLLKIAVYTEDASVAYAKFKSAFGISGFGTHSITLNLTNVSSSNVAISVTAGGSYTTTLSPDEGYAIQNVTVVMGGSDITATAYSGGVITISEVTGNVTIAATAKASSGGQLVTSGLCGFFDCRTAQYDNDGAGGKTTISATQGTGVLFAWAKNCIAQQDTRGFTFASTRSYFYDPAGGTNAADYSGALTIITLGYADTADMGFCISNIRPYWEFRPKHKTAAGTATAEEKHGSGSKAGYCYCVYRVDGNNLNLAMNDEHATYAGEDIDGFTEWDAVVRIGLAAQAGAGMHLVAAAIYNRALTDIELTDMRAYMQTLEVSE